MIEFILKVFVNIKEGLHSGHPFCCTLFFSLFLSSRHVRSRYVKWEIDKSDRKWRIERGAPHVMCPKCVLTCNDVVTRLDDRRVDDKRLTFFRSLLVWYEWMTLNDRDKITHNLRSIENRFNL